MSTNFSGEKRSTFSARSRPSSGKIRRFSRNDRSSGTGPAPSHHTLSWWCRPSRCDEQPTNRPLPAQALATRRFHRRHDADLALPAHVPPSAPPAGFRRVAVPLARPDDGQWPRYRARWGAQTRSGGLDSSPRSAGRGSRMNPGVGGGPGSRNFRIDRFSGTEGGLFKRRTAFR